MLAFNYEVEQRMKQEYLPILEESQGFPGRSRTQLPQLDSPITRWEVTHKYLTSQQSQHFRECQSEYYYTRWKEVQHNFRSFSITAYQLKGSLCGKLLRASELL